VSLESIVISAAGFAIVTLIGIVGKMFWDRMSELARGQKTMLEMAQDISYIKGAQEFRSSLSNSILELEEKISDLASKQLVTDQIIKNLSDNLGKLIESHDRNHAWDGVDRRGHA